MMPFSNANDVVVEMASEVLPVVKKTPVIAGVCASDPGRDTGRFLRQLKDLGFAGVGRVDMCEAAGEQQGGLAVAGSCIPRLGSPRSQ